MKTENRPKIGLALGSGGARGLTQIGILKVLKENNIQIDYIAGVSAGAIVGAYYALNEDISGLEKIIKSMSKKDMLKLIDVISPIKGLEGRKVMEFLINVVGEKKFSDLKIPLKIVATDLENGKETWFSEGKLKDALRASISIPGVFKPYSFNGAHYIDGGIVNPTPVDVVKKMGADIVIAIDHTMAESYHVKNQTSFEVLKRTFEIIRTQTTKLKIGEVDKNTILISVKKKNFEDTYNFYNKNFIPRGEKIGREYIRKIKSAIKEWKRTKF